MRIARFAHPGGMSFGVVEGTGDALVVAQIEGHPFGEIKLTDQRWAIADVRLLSPILPSKVVGIGRNYAAHVAERGTEIPTEPAMFLTPSTAVIGPQDTIKLPPQSKQVEHEGELAVVIGALGARRVSRDQAPASILGYTCANDVTARDLQRIDGNSMRAKGFDSFCPLGPWITTDVSFDDLTIECTVNGETRQRASTKEMIFDVPTLISYISHVMTLLPGDVVLTGTPAGVGPLVDGDQVDVTIDGIGTLSNKVVNL